MPEKFEKKKPGVTNQVVPMPDELYAELDAYAKTLDLTKPQVCRRAIKEYIERGMSVPSSPVAD